MNTVEKLVASGGMAALYALSAPTEQRYFTPLGLAIVTAFAVGPLAIVLTTTAVNRMKSTHGREPTGRRS